MKIVHLRSTRVIFGFGSSSYIFGAALEKHRITKELLENTYIKIKNVGRKYSPKILTSKIFCCPKILIHAFILFSPKFRK